MMVNLDFESIDSVLPTSYVIPCGECAIGIYRRSFEE